MANLFPVFDIPSTLASDTIVGEKFKYAPAFQVETGEFLLNGSGKILYGNGYEAWILWCLKTIQTERWACRAYSNFIGVELVNAMAQPDRKSRESAIERTVTEAILADPKSRTVRVYEFEFKWFGDEVGVSFNLLGAEGDSATITVKY